MMGDALTSMAPVSAQLLTPNAKDGSDMLNSHCGQPLELLYDGCLAAERRCRKCGWIFEQRKRRPAGVDDDTCTWVIHCDQHPGGL